MTLGQYELDRPEQLLALLAAIARNKVASHVRKSDVQRREEWNSKVWAKHMGLSMDTAPGPDRVAAWRDLLEAVRAELTEEERRLSDLRVQAHLGRDRRGNRWTAR